MRFFLYTNLLMFPIFLSCQGLKDDFFHMLLNYYNEMFHSAQHPIMHQSLQVKQDHSILLKYVNMGLSERQGLVINKLRQFQQIIKESRLIRIKISMLLVPLYNFDIFYYCDEQLGEEFLCLTKI